jgi:hypothetical protein
MRLTTGSSRCVAIGYNAGYNETESDKLYIDNTNRGSEAADRALSLVYGTFASTAVAQDFVVNAQLGLNITPTAWLTLPAGSATAGTAPLKFTSGPLTTVAVAGQIEYLSGSFFIRGMDILDVASKVATPEIKTDTTTPTDLIITTGAAKTLTLATPVYVDLLFPLAFARVPASGVPTWDTFTANTSEYSFDVDEYVDLQTGEMPHGWVEGTDGDLHVHVTLKTANNTGSDRFAKFSMWVAYADQSEVWVEQAALTAELTIPTGSAALKHFYLDIGNASLSGYQIGANIKVRLKRIAATGGTEYADRIFVNQIGMHIQVNRIGSRAEKSV